MKPICVLSVCVLYSVSFLICTAVADSCWGGGTSSLLLVETCPFRGGGSGGTIITFICWKRRRVGVVGDSGATGDLFEKVLPLGVFYITAECRPLQVGRDCYNRGLLLAEADGVFHP